MSIREAAALTADSALIRQWPEWARSQAGVDVALVNWLYFVAERIERTARTAEVA